MKPRLAFSHRARRVRLALEQLESRETPAGVVTLSYLNNTISLTGDGNVNGNEVRMTALTTERFRFDGLNGTEFKINGVAGTFSTIDTGALPQGAPAFSFANNGTTALKVTFTGGPDRFEYDGTGVDPTPPPFNVLPPVGFGAMTINVGAGNDTVVLRQLVAKSIAVNSTASTGANTDHDTITILAGGVYDFDNDTNPETYLGGIRGNLAINGQNGNDAVLIAARVIGNIVGAFRDAGDSFTIRGESRIGGSVTVTESPTTTLGTNSFTINENAVIGKSVTFTNTNNAAIAVVGNSTIGGNLTLRSGSGLAGSTFDLSNNVIGGSVALTGGTLQDRITAQVLTIAKSFSAMMGNGGNGVGDSLNNLTISGNLTLTYGTGDDQLSLSNSVIGGSLVVTGSEGLDRITATSVGVARAMTLNMGNGGNGAGDSLTSVTVAGSANLIYGSASGDDLLTIQNSTFSGSVAVNTGAGLDRLAFQNNVVGLNFSFTGGAGGNAGAGNPDLITSTSIGGSFRVIYGVGNEVLEMNNSTVTGAAVISGAGGNDSITIDTVHFLASLAVTGGGGTDIINLANLFVVAATTLSTSGGSDTINISQSGRFQGKVSINTGGAEPDLDTLTIEATANNEITFLGGVSIITGASPIQPPLDTTTIGTQAGKVVVFNGFTYPDAVAVLDNVTLGNNLLIL